jgi:hypothetical protein
MDYKLVFRSDLPDGNIRLVCLKDSGNFCIIRGEYAVLTKTNSPDGVIVDVKGAS